MDAMTKLYLISKPVDGAYLIGPADSKQTYANTIKLGECSDGDIIMVYAPESAAESISLDPGYCGDITAFRADHPTLYKRINPPDPDNPSATTPTDDPVTFAGEPA